MGSPAAHANLRAWSRNEIISAVMLAYRKGDLISLLFSLSCKSPTENPHSTAKCHTAQANKASNQTPKAKQSKQYAIIHEALCLLRPSYRSCRPHHSRTYQRRHYNPSRKRDPSSRREMRSKQSILVLHTGLQRFCRLWLRQSLGDTPGLCGNLNQVRFSGQTGWSCSKLPTEMSEDSLLLIVLLGPCMRLVHYSPRW